MNRTLHLWYTNLTIKKIRRLLFILGLFEFQKENGIKLLKFPMTTQRLNELKMQRTHFLLLNIRYKFAPSKLIKFSHLKNIFFISITFFISKEDRSTLFKLKQKENI